MKTKPQKITIILLWTAILSKLGDLGTTYYAINKFGIQIEQNSIIKWLIKLLQTYMLTLLDCLIINCFT